MKEEPGLFVAESRAAYVGMAGPACRSDWSYLTGVRPSAERERVEADLSKYAGGRRSSYRVAVYVRDEARTSVVDGCGPGAGVGKPGSSLPAGGSRRRKRGPA